MTTVTEAQLNELKKLRAQLGMMIDGQTVTADVTIPQTSHKAWHAFIAGLLIAGLAKLIDVPPELSDSLQGEIANWLAVLGPPLASAIAAWWARNGLKVPG